MNCIHERARIEKGYAQQLTEWAKRWKQLIEKGKRDHTCAYILVPILTIEIGVPTLFYQTGSILNFHQLVSTLELPKYHTRTLPS